MLLKQTELPIHSRGYDARAMADPDPAIPTLTALIALAQAQLAETWAEVRDQNTYALALAALGIAIIGIVAAVQAQLGGDWWVPIPGLGLSSMMALVGTRRVRPGLGINPARFYEDHGTAATKDALAQLLSDLMRTLTTEVPPVLRSQRRTLVAVAALFVITAVYSALLLV
jgi:hypothetical protein